MSYKQEDILGVPVDILTMSDIKRDLLTYFEENKKMTLTSVNPQILLMAEQNEKVKEFVKNSTHKFPDGIGLVKVSKWTKGQIKTRVAGIEVMHEVLHFANEHKKRIFLLGAKPEVAQRASENIARDFPDLTVAGWIDGYTKMSDHDIVSKMNQAQTDMVFVAMGSPKQEEWLQKNLSVLNAVVYQTVGGSLDVISGTVKRAPEFFIKTNLEWLYRSCANPKRFYRIFQLPVFVLKALSWNRKNGEH
ncbi:WecB/TagA/CpsF family glycosyltransferase [Vagococcus carniphilus]|uniref:WecB/TagA/CpsF family glycosyltransferase n=1 Tax=Vagococcus carniphilus TaxID=218144 RepID=A0AAW8U9A2_9ENTE|nr:WecB/TagA/CpsF family glycosyltransferase [Vagococcus carniphilus]MDT2833560.1 WecB/TagA/CpsF family glycosyltransferase [Vagococcus carniphilus]